MVQINRNQAEEIFNNFDVINTQINRNENYLCLIFDLSNGEHLQMNYKHPEGEKSYFILNDGNPTS